MIVGECSSIIKYIINELGYSLVEPRVLQAVKYKVPQKRERVILIAVKKEYQDKAQYSRNKRKVLELLPMGGYWKDLPIDIQKNYMGKSYYSGGGKTGMAKRLSLDEPALILTCAPAQKETERCHPTETRPLTVHEYARIQTFPDDWEFVGNISTQYKQIGNAVPVNLAYALGRSIVRLLNEIT